MKTGSVNWRLQLKVFNTIFIGSLLNAVNYTAFSSDCGDLLLASASQDSLIRIWRISPDENEIQTSSLKSTHGKFSVDFSGTFQFKCYLETVLQGHENWVYGLDWQQPILESKQS